MPDYKRKKVKKGIIPKTRRSKVSREIVIKNTDRKKRNVLPEDEIKVVRGAKLKRKRRMKTLATFVLVFLLSCGFLSTILPGGLFENLVNAVALIGHGEYPGEIVGTNIINTESVGSYYYVLSDTHISAYSNSGKEIFTEMHGFANPIMSVSNTRVLVFDQGGKNVYIYNLSGLVKTLQAKNEIINANISSSGKFAVATHSDSFASTVYVYNKDCELIYTWNSAKDTVNNVLLNQKGDKIAVSTLNAVSGQYDANVLILGFDSADAQYTHKLESNVALTLANSGKGFAIITQNKYEFIHWSKHTVNSVSVSGEINLYRKHKNGILLVSNRANDRSDNTVICISKKGEKTSEFKINASITDIQYSKGRVYYITDTKINILDKSGNLLRFGNCNYGVLKFSVINAHSVAVITDKQIFKIEINKGA